MSVAPALWERGKGVGIAGEGEMRSVRLFFSKYRYEEAGNEEAWAEEKSIFSRISFHVISMTYHISICVTYFVWTTL